MKANELQPEITKILELEEKIKKLKLKKEEIEDDDECLVIINTQKDIISLKPDGEWVKEVIDKLIEESLFHYTKRIGYLERRGMKINNIFANEVENESLE